MSRPQRLVAVLVGALVFLIVAVLVLNLTGVPVAGGPNATASTSASPSPTDGASPTSTEDASRSGDPSPASDEELAAVFAEIEQQVEEIRGLPPAEIGPPEIISREQLAVELREMFEADYPPEEREADNVALRALGLLEPDQDIAELQLDLLGEGVLGFYDSEEQRMVVVSDTGLTAEAKVTYAHEYDHALQDAAFGIDDVRGGDDVEDDLGLARTSLVEGDASLLMLFWAFDHLSQPELVELGEAPLPDTTGIPGWLVAVTEFPYTAGLDWAIAVAAPEGLQPGVGPDFDALDAAFAEPPDTTEQIIHIDKWQSREEAVPLEPVALGAGLGAGWEEVETTTIGEALIAITLEHLGVEPLEAGRAAAGWGGDELVVASGPDDGFALAWRLAWDSAADADDFAAAYEDAMAALDFPARLVEVSETEHLVVHASSEQILEASLAGAQ